MPESTPVPRSVLEISRLAELRRRAAARLHGGAAQHGPDSGAAAALDVLHSLASSPNTAEQALALLHELQVHQTELELQAQELRDTRAELEDLLRRQTERHDGLPVACLALEPGLLVRSLNHTAARLLRMPRDTAIGRPLDVRLAGESLGHLRAAAARVDSGLLRASCRLRVLSPGEPEQTFVAQLAADPGGPGYLLVLTDECDEVPPDADRR